MSRITIYPSRAQGIITAPPSKSMAHRALIMAALAEGESRIGGLSMSEDIKATAGALRCLGAAVDIDENTGTACVRGMDLNAPMRNTDIDCRESGSTLRFLIPLCLLRGERVRLTGSRRLFQRPLGVYEEIFKRDGVFFRRIPDGIELEGRLAGGQYRLRGDVSSQFITGMLTVLPFLGKNSSIAVTGEIQSAPYIDMTIGMQKKFGVHIADPGNEQIFRTSDRSYMPCDVMTEGDWSNAAFLEILGIAAACAGTECQDNRPEKDVIVTGLDEDSAQGDKVYRKYFKMITDDHKDLPVMDIKDCPDLGPVLIAAAAMCHGGVLTGTARLAVKESDRGRAMAEELEKFGMHITVNEDSILVPDAALRAPAEPLSGHNDHRIVMALAALCTITGGVIEGAEAVRKSFPDYFEKIAEAGILLSES